MPEIIIDPLVFAKLKDACMKHGSSEVGLYLLGLFRGEKAYVIDALEFNYARRSGVEVASNPLQKGVLALSLPPILELLGTLHRHLGEGGKPSVTDRKTFVAWSSAGASCHVIADGSCEKMYGYYVDEGIIEATVRVEEIWSDVVADKLIGLDVPLFYMRDMREAELLSSLHSWLIKRAPSILDIDADTKEGRRRYIVRLRGRPYKVLLRRVLRFPLIFFGGSVADVLSSIKILLSDQSVTYRIDEKGRLIEVIQIAGSGED